MLRWPERLLDYWTTVLYRGQVIEKGLLISSQILTYADALDHYFLRRRCPYCYLKSRTIDSVSLHAASRLSGGSILLP